MKTNQLKNASRKLVLLFMGLLAYTGLTANNIQVSNATTTKQGTAADTTIVQFDLSWENSWRHNSSSGGLSYIGVKTGGSNYTDTPKVYIGSQGAVAWAASTAVNAGDLLEVSATPNRYYIVDTDHTTGASAPTHTSGTNSNLTFVEVSDGGGSGATATATLTSNAVTSFSITAAGSGYTALPSVTIAPTNGGSGATADVHIKSWWDAAWVFVKFRLGESDPTFTGVSSSGTTVTVSSTANLRVGMPVVVTSGTGAFAANTVISSITNGTDFVVSASPSTALSNASIACRRIWEHAALDTIDARHTAPSGSKIVVPNDGANGVGAFIYRSAAGSGSNSWSNVGLSWKYGNNNLADGSYIEVKVFAIEMVYVPQGGFVVGSGGNGDSEFYTHTTDVPYQISSENAITVGTSSGNLYYNFSTYGGDRSGPIPAAFPKGYDAFYCMRYEISQGQYRDFLNTLTYAQQVNRTAVVPTSAAGTGALSSTNVNRNGIDIQTPGNATTAVPAVYGCNLDGDGIFNESNDGEWIACGYLTWMDGCAFAQWSGLRPMTELEYEKACRGDQAAVSGEYAWGTSTVATAAYTLSNAGAADEGIATNYSTTNGNASYSTTDGSINGPLRGGIFAANGSNSGRITAGASYYGIMELSGNLWERTVTIGNATGRAFTGHNGNGRLSANGHADQSHWPGISGTEVTGATGSGFRGGAWDLVASSARVSGRNSAADTATFRNRRYGFRGVRVFP